MITTSLLAAIVFSLGLTLQPVKVLRVVFYWLKHYLTNINTHVSNARMNIPKAIRSLKSNGFLSHSTTPILSR